MGEKAMLPLRVDERPYDLPSVVDSRHLSGQHAWNLNGRKLPLRQQKSAFGGAFGDTDNLTGVVDAPSDRGSHAGHVNRDQAPPSEKKAMEYATVLGVDTDDVTVIVDALRRRTVPAKWLVVDRLQRG